MKHLKTVSMSKAIGPKPAMMPEMPIMMPSKKCIKFGKGCPLS
jgi:hypothetical protein